MQKSLEEIMEPMYGFSHDNPLVRRTIQLIQNWPWLLLSIAVCLLIGTIYLRYSTPRYEISASILVKDDTKGTDLGEAAILENLGLSTGKSNVDNEVEILKSRTLMENVVTDLQLYTSYFAKGNIKTTELFETAPIKLRFLTKPVFRDRIKSGVYLLDLSNTNKFILSNEHSKWQHTFGDTINLPEGKAILSKTSYPKPSNTDSYLVSISSPDETTSKYSQALHVSATNKQVSIITLMLKEILPCKGEAVLGVLVANYLKASILDKNRIADSTIAFIDENLSLVTQELTGIEKGIENYRTANQVTDISEQSRMLLTHKSTDEKELTNIKVELNVIESLLAFVENNPAGIIPAYIGMQNSSFTATIDRFNEMLTLKNQALSVNTNDHPTIINYDLQLKNIRTDLLSHLQSRQNELRIVKESLSANIEGVNRQINLIPANERVFLDHTRQQQIKQELYVFLLKKRVETSISKSSTLANGRVIDNPKANDLPVSPNRQLTILLSFLIGLFLPVVFLNIREIFNTRITGRKDLTGLVNIPLIGEIGAQKDMENNLFGAGKHGYVGEQFRTLRTNLRFVPDSEKNKVILITSSMAGEGKTFVSLNLCRSLQLSEKKVILVDCDLRKPTIGSHLGLTGKGLSDYIISEMHAKEFIKPSDLNNSFDVITAGTVPPNPAELLQFDRVKALIIYLKAHYDYVVLDSAPFNLVTDGRILSQHADLSLYVIRQNFTFRHQLETLQEISQDNVLPKLHLILNDVKVIPGYAYGYGNN